MQRRGHVPGWLIGALVAAGLPARAGAQTTAPATSGVQATVTATTVYDDNVLGRPVASADEILRLTPSLGLSVGRSRFNMTGSVSFDAERYQQHRDLTTTQAREVGALSMLFQARPHTTLSWNAGGSSTTNPAELNTLTGLDLGRQRATRWHGGSALRQLFGPHASLDLVYDLSRDQLARGSITTTHSVDVRLLRQPTKRTDFFVHVNGRRFDFGAAGAAPVISTLANAGWSAHGQSAHFTAEAGVEKTKRTLGSTVDVNGGRVFGQTDLSVAYGRGITTALGITRAIAVDHLQVGAVYQGRPTVRGAAGQAATGLRLAARVGGSRNQLPTGTSTSLQWSAEIAKPLARMLVLQIGYDGSTQQGAVAVLGPAGGDIRRNRVTFTLSFIPWSSR